MVPRLRSALSELRRRKVDRVAAVYIAVGLGVLGAAELILDPLGLAAARPYIVILVLLGFPLALVLAWAYELRPESPAPASEETSAATAAAVRSADAGSAVASSRNASPADAGATPLSAGAARSIAVLPFTSMSSDPEGDYFADGITEELTNALSRQAGLRVVARTSAFAFKGERADVREIGQRLGVSHVIEGSVRRTDQALRITAQLVNTGNGYHVWSEQFDRPHGDVFRIQEEIAGCVVGRLVGDVAEGEGPSIARAELSAYDAYLQGRAALSRFHPLAVQQGIDHFETTIRLDDHFAPALAGLAEALTYQAIGFSDRPVAEIMPRAEDAARRALELNPELPEAHLGLALAHMYYRWDYAAARAGFDRALELNPNYTDAHLWQEFYWTYVQRDFERAIAANRRARELSPMDTGIHARLGTVYYLFGKLEPAEQLYREALREYPEEPLFHVGLADTLVRLGKLDEAVSAMEEAVRLAGRPHAFLGMLAAFYGLQGNDAAHQAVLAELEERQRAGYASGFWMAVAYAGGRRMDDAYAALDRAVEERDSNLLYLMATPRALGLHDDPRFPGVMERIGLGHLLSAGDGQ